MDGYRVVLSGSVAHDVRRIGKKNLERLMEAIASLTHNPFPRGYKKLKASQDGYRVRVGNYRIIYEVDTGERIVTVFHIRDRKDAY
jgi:mRNA interferase RelE/StbE